MIHEYGHATKPTNESSSKPKFNESAETATEVDLQAAEKVSRPGGPLSQREPTNPSFVSLEEWTCGCTKALKPHLNDFEEFEQQVRHGLKNLTSQDVCYDYIEVFMVYWKGSDVPEIAHQAQALAEIFRNDPYNFKVTPHQIDYENVEEDQNDIDDAFEKALSTVRGTFLAKGKEASKLLIFYYGGHGVVHGLRRFWTPRKKYSSKHINWSIRRPAMYTFPGDILYLFDCCRALGMVETISEGETHRGRCEILCSAGTKEDSGATNKMMFTGALVDYLTKKARKVRNGEDAIGGLTFEDICIRMRERDISDSLTAEPRWQSVNPNPSIRGRITLAKRGAKMMPNLPLTNDGKSGYESQIDYRSNLSDVRVLVKIQLANPAERLSSSDWLKWFEQRPHNISNVDLAIIKKIEWVGIFESDSSLVLVTVPLWLWHNMDRDPACTSIGTVRSRNLLSTRAKTPPKSFFSPDSSLVASGSADQTVQQLEGHSIGHSSSSQIPLLEKLAAGNHTSWTPIEPAQGPARDEKVGSLKTRPTRSTSPIKSNLEQTTTKGLPATSAVLPQSFNMFQSQGGFNVTQLQKASSRGQEQLVRFLLDRGADVNAQGGRYGNALEAASEGGQEQVVRLLLDRGANVNAQGGRYGTALQAALTHGHEMVVRLLLDKGADINTQGGIYGNALQGASADGYEQIVRLLLDRSADVNAQEEPLGNALRAASEHGHKEIVRLILNKGTNINAQGGYYGTALQIASRYGQEQVVRLLLDRGADVNTQGGFYGTALQAASEGGQEQIVRVLLDKGADVNFQGGRYGTALQAASKHGQEQIVRLLLERGADINLQGGFYGNALQAASEHDHEHVVKLLLSHGARY